MSGWWRIAGRDIPRGLIAGWCLAVAGLLITSVFVSAQDLSDLGDPFGDAAPPILPPGEQPPGDQPAGPADAAEGEMPTAEEIFERGKALAAEGKFAEATELFSQLLAVAPNFAPAAFERGKAFAEMGESQLAMESLSQAINYGFQYPDVYTEALAERGKVRLELQQFQDAADDFTAAVQSQPTNAEYLFLRGKALVRVAQQVSGVDPQAANDAFATAMSSLDRAIELDETNPDAYAERGNAEVSLGNYDKAIDDLEKAAELDPEDVNLQGRLGFVLYRRADNERLAYDVDVDAVIDDYRAAVTAFDRFLQSEGEKTPEEFEDADPDTITPDAAFLGRAVTRLALAHELESAPRNEMYQEAVADCDKALEFNPQMVTALYQRGVANRLLSKLKEAADSFTQALELSPNFGEARLRRGIVWYYLDELGIARGDFERALEDLPDGRAAFWLGLTYADEGDFTEAIWFYSRAIRENPAYKPAFSNRGLAYMQMERYERAADDFEELLRRDFTDEVARKRRDLALKMLAQEHSE